jgi:hypothetical protein
VHMGLADDHMHAVIVVRSVYIHDPACIITYIHTYIAYRDPQA